MNEKIKNLLAIVGVVLFIAYSIYAVLLRQTNEIGPIGFDKVGRQIFLQTLEAENKDAGLRVTSEWEDTTFMERMFIKAPMRTTMRFILDKPAGPYGVHTLQTFLDAPWQTYFMGMGPKTEVFFQEEVRLSLADLYTALGKVGAKTNKDMLAAMGFRRYEIYQGTALVTRHELKSIGRGNMKIMGGE